MIVAVGVAVAGSFVVWLFFVVVVEEEKEVRSGAEGAEDGVEDGVEDMEGDSSE